MVEMSLCQIFKISFVRFKTVKCMEGGLKIPKQLFLDDPNSGNCSFSYAFIIEIYENIKKKFKSFIE